MACSKIGALFITGQSDKNSCDLSPLQQNIAKELTRLDVNVVPLNFPYQETMATYREVNLLWASITNITMYFQSRCIGFAKQYRSIFCEKVSQNPKTLVLAGSCGLELLINLQLPNEILQKLIVFSYGPVARKMPATQCILVQGHKDWLSRYFFSDPDWSINTNHMNYLKSSEMLDILKDTVKQLQQVSTG